MNNKQQGTKASASPEEPQPIKFKQVVIVGNKGTLYSNSPFVSRESQLKGPICNFEILEFGVMRVEVLEGHDRGRVFLIPPTRWEAEELVE